MTVYQDVRTLFFTVLVGVLMAALVGCQETPKPRPALTPKPVKPVKPVKAPPAKAAEAPAKVAKVAEKAEKPASKPPTDSVYLVTSAWRDQGNKPRVLADLRGRVVVVSMVFTHCKYACPRLVADMQKIEKKLTPAQRADVRFLLVSMDPERDTPERLTAFAKKHKLDLNRWILLTGPAGDVRVLNAVLGGRYKKAPSGDFAHSNMVIVLDRQGRIVHRQEGLELPPGEALAAIGKLGSGG